MRIIRLMVILAFLSFTFITMGCGGQGDSGATGVEQAQDVIGWVCVGGNAYRDCYMPTDGVNSDEIIWELTDSSLTGDRYEPIVSGNLLLSWSGDTLYGLNATTGDLLWEFEDEEAEGEYTNFDETFPAISGNRVYIEGYRIGGLYCIDASNGKLLWTACEGMLQGADGSAPIAYKNKVITYTDNCSICSIDAGSGELLWTYKPEESENYLRYNFCIVGDSIIAVSIGWVNDLVNKVYCIDLESGNSLWEKEINAGGFSEPDYSAICSNSKSVFLIASYVPVSIENDFLICIDPSSGEVIWSQPIAKGSSKLVADDSAVYTHSEIGTICLNAADGSEIWSKQMGSNSILAVDNDMLYVFLNGEYSETTGDYDDKLTALNKESGGERWNHGFPDHYGSDMIGFALDSGRLYAYVEVHDEYKLICIGSE